MCIPSEPVPSLASHFGDIGFDVPSMDRYKELILTAKRSGQPIRCPHGAYVRWVPGNGVEMWVHFTRKPGSPNQLEIAGAEPFFGGSSRVKFGLTQTMSKTECELEGSFHGYVSPRTSDPQSGWYPLLVDVSDFDLVRDRIRAPSITDLQITAFPYQVDVYVNDSTFYSSQPGEVDHTEQAKKQKGALNLQQIADRAGSAKLAAESFIPSGLFNPGGTPKNPPKAEGIMAGHIEECNTLTNPFSGRQFYHMHVRTYAATVDVVCDPARLRSAPAPGNVLSGVFWFSGRLVEPVVQSSRT